MCVCSFVWTKEPKATARRKSRGRPSVGLKRAPKAVLQAKRPRFSDGPRDKVFFHGEGYSRRFRSISCSRFGPPVALLRVRPLSPISARREMCVPPVFYMKIGYRASSPSLLPPNQSRRISPWVLVRTKIRLGIGLHSPSKSSICFSLFRKSCYVGIFLLTPTNTLSANPVVKKTHIFFSLRKNCGKGTRLLKIREKARMRNRA